MKKNIKPIIQRELDIYVSIEGFDCSESFSLTYTSHCRNSITIDRISFKPYQLQELNFQIFYSQFIQALVYACRSNANKYWDEEA